MYIVVHVYYHDYTYVSVFNSERNFTAVRQHHLCLILFKVVLFFINKPKIHLLQHTKLNFLPIKICMLQHRQHLHVQYNCCTHYCIVIKGCIMCSNVCVYVRLYKQKCSLHVTKFGVPKQLSCCFILKQFHIAVINT